MRRFVDTLVLLALAGLSVQAWLVHGWLLPDVVSNASMAPTLRGPHRQVVCAGCGLRFSCDAVMDSGDSRSPLAACPDCGARCGDLAALPVLPGDRLLVDRASWNWNSPRRWQTVVLRDPTRPSELVVKRIVGLPSETVDIRGGDIYINGAIARKSLDELRRVAILVHRRPGRLETRQWTIPEPVLDDYAYNVHESRELQPVRDLLLQCRVRAERDGVLQFSAGTPEAKYVLRLDWNRGQAELKGPSAGPESPTPISCGFDGDCLHGGGLLEFAVFDQQVCLAIDGRKVLTCPFLAAHRPEVEDAAWSCELEAQGKIEVADLEVFRDVYYLPSAGREPAASLPCQLGPDEYFVLGDNSPVSVDSRQWQPATPVRREHLFGPVLAVLARGKDDR